MNKFTALGLMSGSSLDGLDIALCEFINDNEHWTYKIIDAITVPYDEEWLLKLQYLAEENAKEIVKTDTDFALLISTFVNDFITKNNHKIDLIASHGHTIFHEPAQSFTHQIGNGQIIAVNTKHKTINDFRTKDVNLGGQGAPLVPIGDKLLFGDYNFCLNIGGIANISFDDNGLRKAFDICGANQILNHLSRQLGKPYDNNGKFAQLGKMNTQLFALLNDDPYFKQDLPKSLSNQYIKTNFIDLVDNFECYIEDKLYTTVKHIAFQINLSIEKHQKGRILVSGGGAHNGFLIKALRRETMHDIVIPNTVVIDFKEALIFAFMGVLRELNKTNCLSSVTGALKDSSGGTIYLP